jgi:hypothetical protein
LTRGQCVLLSTARPFTTIDFIQAYLHKKNLIGEVYVLNDGGEVDLDLGNYERYLNVTLNRDNNITTGKIYREVIDKEVRPRSPVFEIRIVASGKREAGSSIGASEFTFDAP